MDRMYRTLSRDLDRGYTKNDMPASSVYSGLTIHLKVLPVIMQANTECKIMYCGKPQIWSDLIVPYSVGEEEGV